MRKQKPKEETAWIEKKKPTVVCTFVPFAETVAEDKAIYKKVSEAIEKEKAQPITLPRIPQAVNLSSLKSIEQEDTTSGSTSKPINKLTRQVSRLSNKQTLERVKHKLNRVGEKEKKLKHSSSAMYTEVPTQPTVEDQPIMTQSFSRPFIETQLKKCCGDLEKYQSQLKVHLSSLHRSLSNKIRLNEKIEQRLEQSTIIIRKGGTLVKPKEEDATTVTTAMQTVSFTRVIKNFRCIATRHEAPIFYPPARSGSSMKCFEDQSAAFSLLLFGGFNSSPLTEAYLFEANSHRWTATVSRSSPRTRCRT